jgi:hypothetical protein
VYEDFKKGWFGIKRTTKPFSRVPVDLTLEQTINADAASQRMGISYLTDSISARQRWAESHFLRTSVISSVLEEFGLSNKEDTTKDLQKHKIKGDNEALENVMVMLKNTMNPFDKNLDKEQLYNLGSGKAANKDTEKFLLNIEKNGDEARKTFIEECITNTSRFESPIKKQKLNTFATEAGRQKIKKTDGKTVSACLLRDLFGSILYLSLEKKVDMAEVLTYPLTPLPLSLCHVDGIFHKTPKSVLLKYLESKVESQEPAHVDVTVIDAMFFLYLHLNLPATFGGVARYLLARIMESDGLVVHFVSDKWIQPSIKDIERTSRATQTGCVSYQVTGESQKSPPNSTYLAALRNPKFKESLVLFLLESWKEDIFAPIFGNKVLFANYNDTCYKFYVVDKSVIREESHELYSTHEEADSRMFFHMSLVPSPSNIVVRTVDTDCLIIALGCKQYYDEGINIWIEVGTQSKNSLRYINVNQLYSVLGIEICAALPAYHAFSGSDYTASFSRKGKVRPLKALEKSKVFQAAFKHLGETTAIDNEIITAIEKFVCSMYGMKNLHDVNHARFEMFMKRYKPEAKGDKRLSTVKKLDASSLPPCRRVLEEKLKRVVYIANTWMSSVKPHPPLLTPLDYGWSLKEGQFEIVWYSGECCPKSLDVVIEEGDDDCNDSENGKLNHLYGLTRLENILKKHTSNAMPHPYFACMM